MILSGKKIFGEFKKKIYIVTSNQNPL